MENCIDREVKKFLIQRKGTYTVFPEHSGLLLHIRLARNSYVEHLVCWSCIKVALAGGVWRERIWLWWRVICSRR